METKKTPQSEIFLASLNSIDVAADRIKLQISELKKQLEQGG